MGDGGRWSTGVEGGGLVGCARRAGRDSGLIRDGGDGSEVLRWLGVGLNGTSSVSVDTGEVLVFTEAALEDTILIGSGSIVLAADTVKDVLAEVSSVGTSRIASLEAENTSTHEVVPFDSLGEASTPGIGEEETTEWVTTLISTVGVEFSSRVISLDVDELLLDEASDLNVVGGLHELDTSEGTVWDTTSAITGLCAPGNALTLNVTDEGIGFRWAPEAEVIDAVNDGGLAERLLVLGSAVADVVTPLTTTFTVVGISLVGQSSIGEVLRGQRSLCEGDWEKTRDECYGSDDGRHLFFGSCKLERNGAVWAWGDSLRLSND